ncbi:hypothetical protein [Conexibacter sp. DBS9H8]|uniref:hypothetical protein n=1 Tax=Conexibacter sp. DBS9H8 TaxID=2937801 RepID=UPI00200C85FA|nr:hypothetical protein [Conexibacter sp. DBS9H8]MDA8069915.1 hypothetical protein [Actinomycetota bacterium]
MAVVLVVTGPVGVGKSAVLNEAEVMLGDAGVRHATVVLQEIARCTDAGLGDPFNEQIMWRNLASLWSNYSALGIDRLIVEKLVEQREQLRPLSQAVPGARLTIVRLRAPLELIEARIARREPYPDGELSAARWLAPRMDRWRCEDFLVDASGTSVREIAAEVLRVAGWLPAGERT